MNDYTAILYREFRLFTKSRYSILLSLLTPLIYLFLFAAAMGSFLGTVLYRGIEMSYIQFFLPSILIITVFASSSSEAQSIFNEKLSHMLFEIFSCPVRRAAYLTGKITFVSGIALLQALALFAGGILIYDMGLTLTQIAQAVLITLTASICLGCFFIILSSVIDSMQTFGIVFSIVYSVMIFGSSAFYSLERMPLFIRVISLVNPVTYSVNLVRQVLLLDQGMFCTDFAILLVMTFGLLWGAIRAMNRMIDTI